MKNKVQVMSVNDMHRCYGSYGLPEVVVIGSMDRYLEHRADRLEPFTLNADNPYCHSL